VTIIDRMLHLTGNWQATYRLWMSPEAAPAESLSSAILSPMVNGKMVCIEYNWTFNGGMEEGELFIGYEPQSQQVTVVWVDSWHNGDRFMICHGGVRRDGAISVLGSYPAPTGPDWGWRTVIEPGDDQFILRMYNIPPGGEDLLAVEAIYTRGQLP
jgi:hypothetical protein